MPTYRKHFSFFWSLLRIFAALLTHGVDLMVRYIYRMSGKWEWFLPKMAKIKVVINTKSRIGLINNSNKTMYTIKLVVGLCLQEGLFCRGVELLLLPLTSSNHSGSSLIFVDFEVA